MSQLPETDPDFIRQCQADFETTSRSGANDANAECLRYVWALVHSRSSRDVKRGLELAERMLVGNQLEEQWQRDLVYLCAVAKYKLRQYLAARDQLAEILRVSPESRQAQALKQAVDDQIVKEGLIGVGIAGGVLGLAAVIVGGLLASRR